MIVTELQYDAFSGTFRPLDQGAPVRFQDGELYFAIISDSGEVQMEPFDFRLTPVAHA
jgi:hypothetical protein